MSNLKITQKDIMEMVTRSVNMIINEASAASWKKSIINKIYSFKFKTSLLARQ